MAVIIDEPTWFDNFLHYGLFAGAIFQLICIFAVVFVPKSQQEENEDSAPADQSSQSTGRTETYRRGKGKDKKKHR